MYTLSGGLMIGKHLRRIYLPVLEHEVCHWTAAITPGLDNLNRTRLRELA